MVFHPEQKVSARTDVIIGSCTIIPKEEPLIDRFARLRLECGQIIDLNHLRERALCLHPCRQRPFRGRLVLAVSNEGAGEAKVG